MSKLSRRQFLKVAAALTASGTLARRGDRINNSPIVTFDDDSVRQEQPFAPYYVDPDDRMWILDGRLDPDDGMWKVLFSMPMPRGILDGHEV